MQHCFYFTVYKIIRVSLFFFVFLFYYMADDDALAPDFCFDALIT
jgi:hypothetical protein